MATVPTRDRDHEQLVDNINSRKLYTWKLTNWSLKKTLVLLGFIVLFGIMFVFVKTAFFSWLLIAKEIFGVNVDVL